MTLDTDNIIGIISLLAMGSGFAVWCGSLKTKVDANSTDIEQNKKESQEELKETKKELITLINDKLASTEKLTSMMDTVKTELKDYVMVQIKQSEQIKTNQEQTRELSNKVGNLEHKVTSIQQEQALQRQSLQQLVELTEKRMDREDARDEMLRKALERK